MKRRAAIFVFLLAAAAIGVMLWGLKNEPPQSQHLAATSNTNESASPNAVSPLPQATIPQPEAAHLSSQIADNPEDIQTRAALNTTLVKISDLLDAENLHDFIVQFCPERLAQLTPEQRDVWNKASNEALSADGKKAIQILAQTFDAMKTSFPQLNATRDEAIYSMEVNFADPGDTPDISIETLVLKKVDGNWHVTEMGGLTPAL